MVKYLSTIPITPPYYDHRALFNLNPDVIFTEGGRSLGKTNFWKRYGIYDFLDNKHQFIYMRRFKDEIKKAKVNFLLDLYEADDRLAEVELKIAGDRLLVNGEVAGYFVCLSTTTTMKSVVYNQVYTLIYDEFLTIGITVRGHDEIVYFKEYLDTVFRLRTGWKLVMISNAITTTSEYYKLFGFDRPVNPNRRFQSPKHSDKIVLEIYKDSEFRKAKQESQLYTLMKDEKHIKYAIESQMLEDDFDNCMTKKSIRGHTEIIFNLVYEDVTLSVHRCDERRLHLAPYTKNDKVKITFNKEDVIRGAIYCTQASPQAIKLMLALQYNYMTYEDIEVKKTFFLFIKQIVSTFY